MVRAINIVVMLALIRAPGTPDITAAVGWNPVSVPYDPMTYVATQPPSRTPFSVRRRCSPRRKKSPALCSVRDLTRYLSTALSTRTLDVGQRIFEYINLFFLT